MLLTLKLVYSFHSDWIRKLDADIPYFDSACTCKICNHGFARDCKEINCTCCNSDSHTLILDGIEGFAPSILKSENP